MTAGFWNMRIVAWIKKMTIDKPPDLCFVNVSTQIHQLWLIMRSVWVTSCSTSPGHEAVRGIYYLGCNGKVISTDQLRSTAATREA